jgi:Patatin-like phospholipase
VFNLDEIFDRDLYSVCDEGTTAYLNKFESCSYKFPRGAPCISRPEKLHSRHTSAKGETVPGPFLRQGSWNENKRKKWIAEIRNRFMRYYEYFSREVDHTRGENGGSLEHLIHRERQEVHTRHCKIWASIRSNKTCLPCLQAAPDHVLGCGHSYCPRCIQELGKPSSNFECAWVMLGCALCRSAEEERPHLVRLKGRCAGARILTLDGGGIRGIIELSLLRAIDEILGFEIPMRDMVDVIVGTSTGTFILSRVPRSLHLDPKTAN